MRRDRPSDPNQKSVVKTARDRGHRAHGDLTRKEIIEAAGRQFAQYGYHGTTSKAVSERANVNIAAVNYHFGSRDGLYLVVLGEAQQRIFSIEFFQQLIASDRPPEEKLQVFFKHLVGQILQGESWPIQVWAREVLSRTALVEQAFEQALQPMFELFVLLMGDIIGISPGDPRIERLVLSVVSPCLVLIIADPTVRSPFQPLFSQSPGDLADDLYRFALAGLAAAQQR